MGAADSPPETITVPLARDTEVRLAKIRRKLESIYHEVDIAQDEVAVAAEAAKSLGQLHLEKVLRASVAHRLFRQLEALTDVLERLGTTTDLSESRDLTADAAPCSATE